MKRILGFALFLTFSLAEAQSFGTYIGKVVATWDGGGRTMTLVQPFVYVDPSGTRWEAPIGSTIDGASIPKFAWSIIGGPFEGKYRDSSVIHDVACDQKRRPWESVHKTFYTGMLASGVDNIKAKIMYAAVYYFGPRWPMKVTRLVPEKDVTLVIGETRSQFDQRNSITASVEPYFIEGVGVNGSPIKIPTDLKSVIISVVPPTVKMTEAEFASLKRKIEEQDLSLEQIRDYLAEPKP
jgi:hypothetical protein